MHASNDLVAIIANGPSVNKLDLPTLMADIDVIVMNNFFNHPDAPELNIVAYCVGEQGANVSSYDFSRVLQVQSRTFWFSADFADRLSPLKEDVFLYMPGNDRALDLPPRDLNLSRPAPGYETTAQMAIFVALGLGYKKILLFGYDHNFLSAGQFLDHFYAEDDISTRSILIDGSSDYHELIKNCDRMWARYKRIKEYADTKGVKLLNCGTDSYLDVFERYPICISNSSLLTQLMIDD